MGIIRHSSLLLGLGVVLVAGCAGGPLPSGGTSRDLGPDNRNPAAVGPAEFVVNNGSSCYTRVYATDTNRLRTPAVVLAEVPPHHKSTVAVPEGRRLDMMTFAEPNAPRGVPGRDCRSSGQVTWQRVAPSGGTSAE